MDGGEWRAAPRTMLGDSFFQHTIAAYTLGGDWKGDQVELLVRLPRQETIVGVRCHNYYGATVTPSVNMR